MTTGLKMSSKPCHVPCTCMLAHGVKMFVFAVCSSALLCCLLVFQAAGMEFIVQISVALQISCSKQDDMAAVRHMTYMTTYFGIERIFFCAPQMKQMTRMNLAEPYRSPFSVVGGRSSFCDHHQCKKHTHNICRVFRDVSTPAWKKTLRIEHILTSTKVFGSVTICGIYTCVSSNIQFCPIFHHNA